MLNLLKFRETADYTASPELAPDEAISGKDAYRAYARHAFPLLERVGSKVIFRGKCGAALIGPEAEKWDEILLVEHESAEQFIAFAQDPDYLKIAGHRTAALVDSRLVPVST